MNETANPIWSGTTVGISVFRNGVVSIKFDSADKRVNLLSSAVLEELNRALDELDKLTGVSGVIFASGKQDSFIVGADINEIVMAQEQGAATAAFNACERGKAIFARIANLSYPTVAAIHGRCLGGGAELALVCKKRLITDSEGSLIGLPEVGLGVLPGWGGTVRATRMIGLANAMPLILNPLKPFSAKRAWRTGLVSEVVPQAQLNERAMAVAMGSRTRDYRPSFKDRAVRRLSETALGRFVLLRIAHGKIKKATAGKYPAPGVALEVMVSALTNNPRLAFQHESMAFARLVRTPQSKELVQAFLSRKRDGGK